MEKRGKEKTYGLGRNVHDYKRKTTREWTYMGSGEEIVAQINGRKFCGALAGGKGCFEREVKLGNQFYGKWHLKGDLWCIWAH